MGRIENDDFHGFDSAGAQMPNKRGKHPGPSQDVAGAENLDADRSVSRFMRLDRNASAFDQIQSIGGLSLLKDELFRTERRLCRALSNDSEVLGFHACEEWAGLKDLFNRVTHIRPFSLVFIVQ